MREVVPPPGHPGAGRVVYLDALRLVAIIGVVAIHVFSAAFNVGTPGSTGWWLADVTYSGSRWSVPVFFMVSGAVILPRAGTGAPRDFYRRRVRRLGTPLVVWSVVYLAFALARHDITWHDVLPRIARGAPYVHLYFLFAIAGLYVLAPLLARALTGPQAGLLPMSALVALLANGLLPVLGLTAHMSITTVAATRWLPFVGYFLAGLALASAPRLPGRWVWAALAALGLAGQVLLAGWARLAGHPALFSYSGSYSALPVMLAAVALFCLARQVEPVLQPLRRPVVALSELTFGVFLCHLLFVDQATRTFSVGTSVRALVPVFLGALVVSFAVTWVASKLRGARVVFGM